MRQIQATKLREQLDETLRAVEAGEEIEITYRNRPVARIVPIREVQPKSRMAGLDRLRAAKLLAPLPPQDADLDELYDQFLREKYG